MSLATKFFYLSVTACAQPKLAFEDCALTQNDTTYRNFEARP
jgi:hypothetical protein